jgi:hypothetical protein
MDKRREGERGVVLNDRPDILPRGCRRTDSLIPRATDVLSQHRPTELSEIRKMFYICTDK